MCVCLCCVCVCVSLAICESIVTFRRENPFTTGQRIVNVYWCKVVIICRHVLEGGGVRTARRVDRKEIICCPFPSVKLGRKTGVGFWASKGNTKSRSMSWCFVLLL